MHVRAAPVRHDVRHRSYLWFVDLDDLPRLPRAALARFEARDHVGDPAGTLRANLDAFLAEHGIDLHGGQITMLTNARSFGYVFNPLALYWCHDRVRRARLRRRRGAQHVRRNGTATCCGRTTPGARTPRRSSTSRRSTRSTATTG